MTMFRDWPRTLRPASYRGVGFFVEQDSIETGRRLEIHEFPHRDTPYVEDLGRAANKIQVTAYVLSDQADREERALRAACERGGAARLVLPLETLQAHCQTCSREFSRDRLGYVAFKIAFVRDGSAAGPFPVAFLAARVSDLAAAIVGPLADVVGAAYQGLRVPSKVVDAAVATLREIAAVSDAAIRSVPMEASRVPGLLRQAEALFATAPDLARTGAVGNAHAATSFVARASSASARPMVDAIAGLVGGLGAAAGVATGPEALAELIAFDRAAPVRLSPWSRLAAGNDRILATAVRVSALASLAEIIAATVYTDPRAARQARADVAELYDAELQRLVPWRDHALYTQLSALAVAVIDLLSRRVADLAPIVIAEAPRAMPSLWWAARLYGSADRAGELVARNRVVHPSFMPTTFEALAR